VSGDGAMHIQQTPSPNFDARSLPVSLLILHYTNMDSPEAAVARLCDQQSKVSAHYLISQTGEIIQMVDEASRAWHAGVAFWGGIEDVNSASIGIELDHQGHAADGTMAAYPEAQIASLIDLSQDIIARHNIAAAGVLGHSDVAPGRKTDPGEALDWARLAGHGIGLWLDAVAVEPVEALRRDMQNPAVAALQQALSAFGYKVAQDGVFGAALEAVIISFQRHFRPTRVDGVADAETQTLIYALCRAARRH